MVGEPNFDWEDVCGHFYVGASLAHGDGYWPSMVNVDATELSGSITSNCARELAAMLHRAADACDAENKARRDADDREAARILSRGGEAE